MPLKSRVEYEELINLLRLDRFLYNTRCPHSRQRTSSRGLISFSVRHSTKHIIGTNRISSLVVKLIADNAHKNLLNLNKRCNYEYNINHSIS